jgi:hypothetical protein
MTPARITLTVDTPRAVAASVAALVAGRELCGKEVSQRGFRDIVAQGL